MRRFHFSIAFLTMLTFILVACGSNDSNHSNESEDTNGPDETIETAELEYEPEDIKDTDVCEVCGMAVPNNQHATQIVLQNHKSLKFDDIGCLHEWKAEHGEDEIGAEFVRDFYTEDWIQIKEATFVYDEDIDTPMAYGVISFQNKEDAEKYMEEEGKGTILDATALASHEWKMNMDHGDHDHGDHDEHDDDDHQNHE